MSINHNFVPYILWVVVVSFDTHDITFLLNQHNEHRKTSITTATSMFNAQKHLEESYIFLCCMLFPCRQGIELLFCHLQNFLQKKKKKLNVIEKWSQSLKQIYRNNIHVCSQIYKLKIRGDSLAEWFSLVTPD